MITGTAGWEALLMGVPVLTFAHTIFSDIGQTYKCTNLEKLPELIIKALNNKNKHSKKDMIKKLNAFVSSVFDHTVDIKTDDLWGEHVRLGNYNETSDMIIKIANAIEKKINLK